MMKKLILSFLFTLVSSCFYASDWIVEAENGGYVSWSKDSVADIHAPGGLTLWNTHCMSGNVVIEYDARIVGDGRVSDLNCFWMASVKNAKDKYSSPITKSLLKQRGGRFLQSYTMQLYYMGYGGNYNKTTRFRRYDGDVRGVDDATYRPAILREYLDSTHLIKGDHWYHIRLEQIDGRVRYLIDGECLVDFVDPNPLVTGYFGFRTTLAHAQLKNFSFRTIDSDEAPLVVRNIFGKGLPGCKPATFGVPFLRGELTPSDVLGIKTVDGRSIASDQWTLASWPDGSVKWKAVAMVADGDTVFVSRGANGKQRKGASSSTLDDGMRLYIATDGSVLDSVTVYGKKVMGRLWMEQNGAMQPVRNAVKEREGNVRTCWRFDGDNFIVRLYQYKGSNELQLVHTVFIDSLTNANGLRSLSVKSEVPMSNNLCLRKVIFGGDMDSEVALDVQPLVSRRAISVDSEGNPADSLSRLLVPQLASWDGFRLSQLSPKAFSIRKRATAQSPWIGTIEGYKSDGVVAIGDKHQSVLYHLADFWQSYPSTLQVDDARTGNAVVSLSLWSSEAEPMSFCHYDTVPHGLEASYEDVQPGMSTANGIARTSIIYITSMTSAIDSLRGKICEASSHAVYLPTPEYLHRKRAFGYWSLDRGTSLDTTLSAITDFYANEQKRNNWYGFFNYGDFMHTYDVSRGEWRYDVGGFAWDNTELATPAMLWYEFLRTGSSCVWEMAVSMSRHNAEVDCYHRGPHRGLGTRHNVLHWGCGAKEARISQAFWNRFMYYLTADERMGDIIHEVVDADQLLYTLDPMRLAQPRSERYPCTAPARLRIGPDWVAYVANWFTEWERSGNIYYRDKIMTGMKSIAAMPNGIFTGPKALGYDPATGVISWEGDSAVQNTNHLLPIMGGFEMMNEVMMSLNTPEWDRIWLRFTMDYRDKALSISKNKFRIPRLPAYAYWHTGDRRYWHSAMEQLRKSSTCIPVIQGFDKPIISTNDATTFMLDAIFMQEVMGDVMDKTE